jgi:hypothetical protein
MTLGLPAFGLPSQSPSDVHYVAAGGPRIRVSGRSAKAEPQGVEEGRPMGLFVAEGRTAAL